MQTQSGLQTVSQQGISNTHWLLSNRMQEEGKRAEPPPLCMPSQGGAGGLKSEDSRGLAAAYGFGTGQATPVRA